MSSEMLAEISDVAEVVAKEELDEDVLCEHLRDVGRGDLQIYVAEDYLEDLSYDECVKLLIEKYPVKRISKKEYKPDDSD